MKKEIQHISFQTLVADEKVNSVIHILLENDGKGYSGAYEWRAKKLCPSSGRGIKLTLSLPAYKQRKEEP